MEATASDMYIQFGPLVGQTNPTGLDVQVSVPIAES